MSTKTLDAGQKHILGLIDRDKKADGWTPVSAVLLPVLKENIPSELATFEPNDDGTGRAKLTEAGQEIINAMAWL